MKMKFANADENSSSVALTTNGVLMILFASIGALGFCDFLPGSSPGITNSTN